MPYRSSDLRADAPAKRPRWVAAGLLATLTVASATAAVFARRPASAPPTPAPRPEAPPWPSQARAWTVHRDADGTRQVIFGPLRFTVTAGGVATASGTRFEAALVAAVPVTSGWVFVSADGAVATSERFLGEPRAVGRFPCAFRVARDSVGRAVFVDGDGGLWTTDGGNAGLVPHRLPGDVRAATFIDADHGAAVLRDGRVMLTANAGQHWERLDLERDVAWDVTPGVDGVSLATTGGVETYRWTLGPQLGAPVTARPGRVLLDRSEEDRLRPFINVRDTLFVADGPAARCRAATAPAARRDPIVLYDCTADRPLGPLTTLPLLRPRNADAGDLLTGTEAGPVRALFWRPRPDRLRETRVRVGWRGADDRGPVQGSTHASGLGLGVHMDVHDRGPLTVAAFTRRGALVLTREGDAPVLAWGSAARPFVRVRDAFVEQSPPGLRSFFLAAPDEGATVAWSRPLYDDAPETWSRSWVTRPSQVGVVLDLDPQGAVRARQGYTGEDDAPPVMARGRGAVGPVSREPGEPPRWRMVPTDGTEPKMLPAPLWSEVRPCDGPVAGDVVMSVAYPPIGFGAGQPAGVGTVSRAELAVQADGRLCVRAILLAGRRLVASSGDRFEGAGLRCLLRGAR